MFGEAEDHDPHGKSFWIDAALSVAIVLFAGLMAGLTMGAVSLDPTYIAIVSTTGTPSQQRQAKRLKFFVDRHHLTLVTLLLGNSLANESLPLVLDHLVSPLQAVILSVTAVLVVGEILPSAIFTGPKQLQITAFLCPLLWVMVVIMAPLAFPIAWLLDRCLGHDHGTRYRRGELKAFLELHRDDSSSVAPAGAGGMATPGLTRSTVHRGSSLSLIGGRGAQAITESTAAGLFVVAGPNKEASTMESTLLSNDEVTIMSSTLELKTRPVLSSMIPLDKVFMLSMEDKMTDATMDTLLRSTHSRVPVFQGTIDSVVGVLIVKFCIKLDPEEATPISSISLEEPLYMHSHTSMLDAINVFQAGKGHMAFITPDQPPYSPARQPRILGILTLEDCFEALLQEPIEDESDLRAMVSRRRKAPRASPPSASVNLSEPLLAQASPGKYT